MEKTIEDIYNALAAINDTLENRLVNVADRLLAIEQSIDRLPVMLEQKLEGIADEIEKARKA
jgi:hypothetical protein